MLHEEHGDEVFLMLMPNQAETEEDVEAVVVAKLEVRFVKKCLVTKFLMLKSKGDFKLKFFSRFLSDWMGLKLGMIFLVGEQMFKICEFPMPIRLL